MDALQQLNEEFTIFNQIASHPTWRGSISGLNAEKLLRGKKIPFLFLIREGEDTNISNERNYYITFVLEDMTIKHQPLWVHIGSEGWRYENTGPCGPMKDRTIDDVLHQIMHCEEGQPKPLLD